MDERLSAPLFMTQKSTFDNTLMMDSRQKVGISLYAILSALVALVGFRFGEFVPNVTIYILIAGLFVVLAVLAVQTDVSPRLASPLLLSLICLLGLLVVDPLEAGFYGYDPYVTFRALEEFQTNGPLWLANERGAWPGFYAYTWLVTSLLGLDPATVGKYIPMIAAGIPLACFVAARRLADTQTAFLAAIGVIGVRTLIAFEMKFLDETVAATLLFVILAVLAIQQDVIKDSRTYTVLLSLFAVTAILTHHYVGLLVTVLLCIWALSQTEFVGRTTLFEGFRRPHSSAGTAALIASAMFVVVLLVVANSFVFSMLGTVDLDPSSGGFLDSDNNGAGTPSTDPQTVADSETSSTTTSSGPSTTQAGGGTSTGTTTASVPPESEGNGGDGGVVVSRFIQLLSANTVIIGVFGLTIVSFLRNRDYERETLALSIFTGILAVVYGWSVVFGRIIPLDPSRFILFMMAPLLIITSICVSRLNSTIFLRAFSLLVAVLAITQLVLIPPAVWYSDQADTTVGEGHYSPSQFDASEWAADYDSDSITGWEKGLWVSNDIHLSSHASDEGTCGQLYVWRDDIQKPRPTGSILYDVGSMAIYACGPLSTS